MHQASIHIIMSSATQWTRIQQNPEVLISTMSRKCRDCMKVCLFGLGCGWRWTVSFKFWLHLLFLALQLFWYGSEEKNSILWSLAVQSIASHLSDWPITAPTYFFLVHADYQVKMKGVPLVTLVALQLLTARNHQRSRALRNLLMLWQLSHPLLFSVLLWNTQPDDRLIAPTAVRLTTWCSVTFRTDSFSRHVCGEDIRVLTTPQASQILRDL